MADLSTASTIAGFPIITEGNFKDYLFENIDDPFITTSQSRSKFIEKKTNQNMTKDGDVYIDKNNEELYMKISNGWIKIILSVSGGTNPPGSIIMHSLSNISNGYILCDGREISRAQYQNLFNVIGTTFGSGNGSTTFNVPNFNNNFIRSMDKGRGIDRNRALGSYQQNSIKSHNHTGNTNTTGKHRHIMPNNPHMTPDSPSYTPDRWGGIYSTNREYTSYNNDHTHYFETTSTGGSETRPRNISFYFYITT